MPVMRQPLRREGVFSGTPGKCPICTASVTARQEEKPRPETEEQDAVPCLCHICGNSFAVRAACVGSRVECPVCHSAVTAVKREEALSTFPGRTPEAAEKAPGNPKHTAIPPSAAGVPHTSAYSAPHTPLAPKKKTDKRTISVHGPTTPGPNKSMTKIRKRKEGNAAPAIAAPRCAALAPEEPEYRAAAADTMRSERRPTWHIWLFVAGLVLSLLGVFMFLRGRDMEAENSKLLNISDRFVDHEALFSQEVNKDLLEQLQQRERQYLIAHSRREEDRKAESISPHITAAMNELALYCMAESDEERLNYVMNPAAVAPKMAYWASYGQYKDYLPQEAGRSSKTGTCFRSPC